MLSLNIEPRNYRLYRRYNRFHFFFHKRTCNNRIISTRKNVESTGTIAYSPVLRQKQNR